MNSIVVEKFTVSSLAREPGEVGCEFAAGRSFAIGSWAKRLGRRLETLWAARLACGSEEICYLAKELSNYTVESIAWFLMTA